MVDQYLTTKELSKLIKMTPGAIRNLVSQGTLRRNVHYVKPTARKILFVSSAITDWLYGQSPIGQPHFSSTGRAIKGRINI